ncbi:MAG TPA: hypothetical protein VN769_12630 [Xanthobacteraceae bacterium]|nr:hypothetical protein [Xanthobacteraceae bacterium]
MPRLAIAAVGLSLAIAGTLYVKSAQAQGATVPLRPSETAIPPDVIYPDAVVCNVISPDDINYKIIFYKSQTVSFAHEPNNVAEYGTPFLRGPDKFDSSAPNKWRLQLGQPGNITLFTLPSGWKTDNCPVGKSLASLRAEKQLLKLFSPE